MIFALLGDIRIGDAVWTGPDSADEERKAALVEHKVARGKPPVQDMGDDNDTKTLTFFFDETFCEPEAELSLLTTAFEIRQPLAYVGGDGSFRGVRWLVEQLKVKTLKTTLAGRPVRMKVTLKMLECPAPSPLTFFSQIARAAATGLAAIGGGNVGAKR
jgi:phage protein U